jgi:UDP-glucose 4-epimerase
VDRLVNNGYDVVAFDNFSTGQEEFIAGVIDNPRYLLVRADLLDLDAIRAAMAG